MSSPSTDGPDDEPQPDDASDAATAIRLWEQTYSGIILANGKACLTYKHPAPQAPAGEQERPPAIVATLPLPGLTSMPALPAPSQGARDFTLREKIGEGGMGVVWSAEQASLWREVAVKQLKPHGHSPQETTVLEELFVSESLVTAFLDHPNVVPVHAMGRDEQGRLFLAMKRVQGTTWRSLLHPSTPAEEAKAKGYDREAHLRLLLSVCHAVAFAHSKGFIHRDLKPENVMVGDYGEVWVMDWGLALDVREKATPPVRTPHRSSVTNASGTPAYMAPEMALGQGQKQGFWTDVYLLGGILHEILTGKPPHGGETAREALASAAQGQPPQFCADVPQDLATVCRRALAKEPAQRYQDVASFRSAVEDHLRHAQSIALADKAGQEMDVLSACARQVGRQAAEGGRPGPSRQHAMDSLKALYSRYAEVVARYTQALELWPENEPARHGLLKAYLGYAVAAFVAGDLGLAQAQIDEMGGITMKGRTGEESLDEAETARKQLEARIHKDSVEREWRQETGRRARIGLVVAAAALIVGLTVGFFWIRAEQTATALERDRAVEARNAEAGERQRAEQAQAAEGEQRRVALASAREARLQLARGMIAQGDALVAAGRVTEAWALALDGRARLKALGEPTFSAELLIWECARRCPPALRSMPAGGPRCLVFSPKGKWAISGCSDQTLKLWDVAMGREVRVFHGHEGSVNSVAFSPDGNWVLSGSEDKTAKLWEVATGRELRTFQGHTKNVTNVAFSPDGKWALSGSGDNTLKLWDVATARELRTFRGHTDGVHAVAFSPDGKRALSGSWDNTLKLWDVLTAKELRTFRGHTGGVLGLSFSPDGKWALSGSVDQTLKLWDVITGREVRTFEGHTGLVDTVFFSPDGGSALSGSWDNTVKLWDVATGREVRAFQGHTNWVTSVAFSPDGKRALSGSFDDALKLWDIEADQESRTYQWLAEEVPCVAFSPDGKWVLSGTAHHTVELWDAATGREVRTLHGHTGPVSSAAFSPDGRWVLSGSSDNTLKLWDMATGREVRTFHGHSGRVTSVAFSPDGKWALSGSEDKTLKLWEAATGREVRTFQGHTNWVTSVVFASDGRRALSGSSDNTLRLWDVATGREVRAFQGHTSWVTSVALSPNEKWALSGSEDKSLKLWDMTTGREVRTFQGHGGSVNSVAFSLDGDWALSGSEDRTVKLWEVATGREIRSLRGHTRPVKSVSFSPDGKSAVSGGKDGALRLWLWSRAEVYIEFEERLKSATAALRGDPENTGALRALGEWYAFRGVWEWAVDLLESARRRGATIDRVGLARCYWQLGKYAEAGREFQVELEQANALPVSQQRNWDILYLEMCLDILHQANGEDKRRTKESRLKEATECLDRGSTLQSRGELEGAIREFEKAIEVDPRSAEAFCSRGSVLQNRDDLDGALRDYNKAIELDPEFAAAYCNRGGILQSKGDLEGALRDYNKAIELDPKSAAPYCNRGGILQNRDDLDGALRDYNKAIELDPKSAAPYCNRGGVLQSKGDLEGALRDYNKAVELDPKLALAYNNRGFALQNKGDLDGAIRDYNNAIEFDPKLAIAYNNRGFALQNKGDLEGAVRDYSKTIELDPKNSAVYCNRGLALQNKGDLEGAVRDYNKAIELDPKNALAYCNRGFTLQRKGDLDGALRDYNRAIEFDPKFAGAYCNRGVALGRRGDWQGAMRDYVKAIQLDPTNAAAHNGYAWQLLTCADEKLRDPKTALVHAEKAVELDKGKIYSSLDTLALAFFRNGKVKDAVQLQRKVISMLPPELAAEKVKEFTDRLREYEAALAKPDGQR